MRPLDVVYFVRPGDHNEELRYSLRSLVNLPHKRVIIVGYTPAWVQGVESIPGNVFRDKWMNVVDNLRIAAVNVKAKQFVIMNDDIFIMQQPDLSVPLLRGTLSDQISKAGRGPWRDSLEKTYAYLASEGYDVPMSYELHYPVVMERERLLRVARLALGWKGNPPQWRTLYGNLYNIGGVVAADGKIARGTRKDYRNLPVLSTEDTVFRQHDVGRFIRSRFRETCEYEGDGGPARVNPLTGRTMNPSPMYGLGG